LFTASQLLAQLPPRATGTETRQRIVNNRFAMREDCGRRQLEQTLIVKDRLQCEIGRRFRSLVATSKLDWRI